MPSFWSLDVDGLIVFKRWVVFSGFPSGILGWFLGLLLIDLPGLERVCPLLFGRHVLSSVQLNIIIFFTHPLGSQHLFLQNLYGPEFSS